jgi:hypothetical protein
VPLAEIGAGLPLAERSDARRGEGEAPGGELEAHLSRNNSRCHHFVFFVADEEVRAKRPGSVTKSAPARRWPSGAKAGESKAGEAIVSSTSVTRFFGTESRRLLCGCYFGTHNNN